MLNVIRPAKRGRRLFGVPSFPTLWPDESESQYRVRAEVRVVKFVNAVLDSDVRFQPLISDDDDGRLLRKMYATIALLDGATADSLVARDRTLTGVERKFLYEVAAREWKRREKFAVDDLCDRLADAANAQRAQHDAGLVPSITGYEYLTNDEHVASGYLLGGHFASEGGR